VWACGRGQTDTQTRVTTIHFSWSSTHAKCYYVIWHSSATLHGHTVCVFLFLTVKSHEMIAIQKDKRVHEQTITTLNRNRRKKTEKNFCNLSVSRRQLLTFYVTNTLKFVRVYLPRKQHSKVVQCTLFQPRQHWRRLWTLCSLPPLSCADGILQTQNCTCQTLERRLSASVNQMLLPRRRVSDARRCLMTDTAPVTQAGLTQ